MKYKAIKVDMDYCADPIWLSDDGEVFANGSLSEFDKVLSKNLLHGLEVYRSLWEKAHWSEYMSPTMSFTWDGEDLVHDCLKKMQRELAAQLKKELPDMRVFYTQRDSHGKYILVEVGETPNR